MKNLIFFFITLTSSFIVSAEGPSKFCYRSDGSEIDCQTRQLVTRPRNTTKFCYRSDGSEIDCQTRQLVTRPQNTTKFCYRSDGSEIECEENKTISGCEGGEVSSDGLTITCPNGNVFRLSTREISYGRNLLEALEDTVHQNGLNYERNAVSK